MAKDTPAAGDLKTVAAIDIGSNSIRMEIADVTADGEIVVIEKLQRATRLGQDTFRRGRLTGPAMRAAINVLRDYRRILEAYHIQRVRAVATSAVREATNADTFLDRIYMAADFDVEVIQTTEESRLTVSAVLQALGGTMGIKRGTSLVAEVGGGSTLLTMLKRGKIAVSQSLRLGSIRLQEALGTTYEPPERTVELLENQIATVLNSVRTSLPVGKVTKLIAVGADARFAAAQVGRPASREGLHTVDREAFETLCARCTPHTADELVSAYGMPYADAETLVPALLVYRILLRETKAEQIIVPHVSMRDGLVLDVALGVRERDDPTFTEGVLRSASAVAEKYAVDTTHAESVAQMAVRVFDAMTDEHGLGPRERLLLEVAARVHEVGGYVSNRAHHKHSYYLLVNSEIFGLTRDELVTVAMVSRYHRRAVPKPSHTEYMGLPRDQRMVVSKLAAMLRVADAVDRGHGHRVPKIRCEADDEELLITVPGATDLSLERRALEIKGDLFTDVFGLRVRLEEDQSAPVERRARAVE